MPGVILEATITCPACGDRRRETMPEDACLWFRGCPACGTVARPKPGDCCVFCSWADRPCPPRQAEAGRGEGCAGAQGSCQ